MTAITKEILVELLDKQKDDFLSATKEEIKSAFMLLAIDTDNPQEMQELMAWVRGAKRREETIKARVLGKATDFIIGIVLTLLTIGFLYSYMNYQNYALIRDEKAKISKIIKTKNRIGE